MDDTVQLPALREIPFFTTNQSKAGGGYGSRGLRHKPPLPPAAGRKKGVASGFFIHMQRRQSPPGPCFAPCTNNVAGGIIETAMCRLFGCVWRVWFSVCRRLVFPHHASALHFFIVPYIQIIPHSPTKSSGGIFLLFEAHLPWLIPQPHNGPEADVWRFRMRKLPCGIRCTAGRTCQSRSCCSA